MVSMILLSSKPPFITHKSHSSWCCFMILQVVFVLFVFSHRPKSTPTPTASLSANGVPTEAVDYDRLKQVSRHF